MGGKKEMEQKKEIDESKEGGRLKDKLSKIGKTLKRILPMKETLAVAGIAVMSQTVPSCTTRFDAPPYDSTEDTHPDNAPDISSEADAPIDMESDADVIEDMNGDDGREPCPALPDSSVRMDNIELLRGESVTVNSITVTADSIDETASEVHYTFGCSGISLEGGLTISGEYIAQMKTYPEDGIRILIFQRDVMINSVLFDVTVEQM